MELGDCEQKSKHGPIDFNSNERHNFGSETYRFVGLPPENFVRRRTYRLFVWLITGAQFREFLLFFVETVKVVCVVTLIVGTGEMTTFQCNRPAQLIVAGLPLNPVGNTENDMRCDNEIKEKFIFPTLRKYYSANVGDFFVNDSFVNFTAFDIASSVANDTFAYAADLYNHICEPETYAPVTLGKSVVWLLYAEILMFVALIAILPSVNLVHKRGVLKKAHNVSEKFVCFFFVPGHKLKLTVINYFFICLATIFFVSSAMVWTFQELNYTYTTYFGVACQLSHELWYFTRPMALLNWIMAVATIFPLINYGCVYYIVGKAFPLFVSDSAILVSVKYLQLSSENVNKHFE
jgi:hypothetical protein